MIHSSWSLKPDSELQAARIPSGTAAVRQGTARMSRASSRASKDCRVDSGVGPSDEAQRLTAEEQARQIRIVSASGTTTCGALGEPLGRGRTGAVGQLGARQLPETGPLGVDETRDGVAHLLEVGRRLDAGRHVARHLGE